MDPWWGAGLSNGDKVGLNPGSLDPSTTRAIPPPPRSIPRSPQAFTTACITELPCTHVWAAIALRKRPTYGRPDAQHTTGPTDRSVAQSLPPPRPTQFHFLLLHPCHIPRYTLSLVSTAWLVFSSDSSPCRALTAILSWRRAYSSASKTGGPVSQIERSAARGNRALTEGQLLERAPRRLGPQEPDQDGLDADPAAVDEQVLPANGLRACVWTDWLATATNSMTGRATMSGCLDIPIGLTLVPKNCAALPQNWKMAMPRARWAYGKISMR